MKHLKEYHKVYTSGVTREQVVQYFEDCVNNNVEGVKAFLDLGYYPDKEIYGYGGENRTMNALELACKHGSIDVVKLFMQYDEFDFTKHSNLPLRYAMYGNHVETARLLLTIDEIEVVDGNVNYDVFHTCLPRKNYEMIKMFLDETDVLTGGRADSYMRNAFKVAAETNDLILLKLLRKYSGTPTTILKDYETIDAITHDNEKIFNMYFNQDYAQAFKDFNWYLIMTKRTKSFNIFKTLYDNPKSKPEESNYNYFRESCDLPNADRINYMLNVSDVELNPGVNNNEAVRRAAEHGRIENMKLLMADDRINPADSNNRALIVACQKEQLEAAELLLTDERVLDDITSIIFPTKKFYNGPLKFDEFPQMLIDVLIKEFELETSEDLNQLLNMMKKV